MSKATEKGAEPESSADLRTPTLHLFLAAQLLLQYSRGIGCKWWSHWLGHMWSGQTIFIDLSIREAVCKINSMVRGAVCSLECRFKEFFWKFRIFLHTKQRTNISLTSKKIARLNSSPVLNAANTFLQELFLWSYFFFFLEANRAYFKAGGLQERFRTRKAIIFPYVLLTFCKFNRHWNPIIVLLSSANVKPFS